MFILFPSQPFKNAIRFMLTICGGLFVVCGSKAIGFPAAGALGCAVLALTANASWKSSNLVTGDEVRTEESSSQSSVDIT